MRVLLEPQRRIAGNAVLPHAPVRIADAFLVVIVGLVDRVVGVRTESGEQLRERAAVRVEALARGVAAERLVEIGLRCGFGDDGLHCITKEGFGPSVTRDVLRSIDDRRGDNLGTRVGAGLLVGGWL